MPLMSHHWHNNRINYEAYEEIVYPPKGRILLLVLMLCLGLSKVQADDSGLITEQVKINVVEAGTLCDRIKSDLKYKIISLKLSGKLNIDDILYIREMAGCYYDTKGSKYDGHLEDLDISDVTLIGTDKDVDVYFIRQPTGLHLLEEVFGGFADTPNIGKWTFCLFAYVAVCHSPKEGAGNWF